MFIDMTFSSPIYERLRALGFSNVFEVNFGLTHTPDRAKAYMWDRMREDLFSVMSGNPPICQQQSLCGIKLNIQVFFFPPVVHLDCMKKCTLLFLRLLLLVPGRRRRLRFRRGLKGGHILLQLLNVVFEVLIAGRFLRRIGFGIAAEGRNDDQQQPEATGDRLGGEERLACVDIPGT
jgi:hypothetical protein